MAASSRCLTQKGRRSKRRRQTHHLKFAQPRTLGPKVSDEFTVPLCRSHHESLHRQGDEGAWWTTCKSLPYPKPKSFGTEVMCI